VKEIPLTKGYVALVDDADYEQLSKHRWIASVRQQRNGVKVYAWRHTGRRSPHVYMHREIIDAQKGEICDHRDGNGTNNQRHNLRRTNDQLNHANTIKRFRNGRASSRWIGVYRQSKRSTWAAQIFRRYIGSFKEECDAATAYNFAAFEAFGEFASENLP
jgi:hypothetical protein